MYTVTAGEMVADYATRDEAIAAAKALSDERRGKVEVADDDGREMLTYRNGELEFYVYETRPKRRPRT